MMKLLIKLFSILLLLYLSTDKSTSLPLGDILQAQSFEQIQTSLKKEKTSVLLHILCEKEKKEKAIPISCYKLSKNLSDVDSWCLSLRISHLKSDRLKKTLKTKVLSSACRNHLEKQLKIFIYRKKDFLLLELKNHWTDESFFF